MFANAWPFDGVVERHHACTRWCATEDVQDDDDEEGSGPKWMYGKCAIDIPPPSLLKTSFSMEAASFSRARAAFRDSWIPSAYE
jgi:hypothetical protein